MAKAIHYNMEAKPGEFGVKGSDAVATVARNLPADTGRIEAKGKPAIMTAEEVERREDAIAKLEAIVAEINKESGA